MKRFFVFLFSALLLLLAFTSCDNQDTLRKSNLKIGMILYADKNDPYIALHIDGINRLQSDLKLKDNRVFKIMNVLESDCYDSIAELVEKGCNLIFSVGKSFEDYMVQSAMENPGVHFCVADGEQAQTNQLNNLHSYSMKEFEARYKRAVTCSLGNL